MCPVTPLRPNVSESKHQVIFLSKLSPVLDSMPMVCDVPGAQTANTQVSAFILLLTFHEYCMYEKLATQKLRKIKTFPGFLRQKN